LKGSPGFSPRGITRGMIDDAPATEDEKAFWDQAYCAALNGLVDWEHDSVTTAESAHAQATESLRRRRKARGETV
jgi:hypothetical protein